MSGTEIHQLPDGAGFRIDEGRRTTGGARLTLHGELDLSVVDDLTTRLTALRDSGRPTELDLSGLSFIDSTGLGALLMAMVHAQRDGWRLTIAPELSRPVRRMVDITGARRYLWPTAAGDDPAAAADA